MVDASQVVLDGNAAVQEKNPEDFEADVIPDEGLGATKPTKTMQKTVNKTKAIPKKKPPPTYLKGTIATKQMARPTPT